MNILGIDSSGLVASVAVVRDGILLGEYTVDYKKTHSQTLLPMLDALMQMLEMKPEDLDAIAVAAGPGSFTGLRIGSATAKGIAMAIDRPIVPVPTTAGIAFGLYGASGDIVPLMDARRHQTYTGIYRFTKQPGSEELLFETVLEPCAVMLEELIGRVNENNRPVVFAGDGIPVFADDIRKLCRVDFSFAPEHQSRQRAGSVAALGARLFAQGVAETAAEHRPVYLRLSQAERERLAEEKKKGTIE